MNHFNKKLKFSSHQLSKSYFWSEQKNEDNSSSSVAHIKQISSPKAFLAKEKYSDEFWIPGVSNDRP